MNDELSLKAQEAVALYLQANKAAQFNSTESGKQEEDKNLQIWGRSGDLLILIIS